MEIKIKNKDLFIVNFNINAFIISNCDLDIFKKVLSDNDIKFNVKPLLDSYFIFVENYKIFSYSELHKYNKDSIINFCCGCW